jgi:hypothetical protein
MTAWLPIRAHDGNLIDVVDGGDVSVLVLQWGRGVIQYRVAADPVNETMSELADRARTLVGHRVSFDTRQADDGAVVEAISIEDRGAIADFDPEAPEFLPLARHHTDLAPGLLTSVEFDVESSHWVAALASSGERFTIRTRRTDGLGTAGVAELATKMRIFVGRHVLIGTAGDLARRVTAGCDHGPGGCRA